MTKIKRKSGGLREGAGRPPQNISIGRIFKIRTGEQVLINSIFPDGSATGGRLARIELGGDTKNRIIRLVCDDGETIVIGLSR